MGSLFSGLSVSSNALGAFSRALSVDQSNIANSTTPGYAAQRATIVPISGDNLGGTGDFVTISSTADSITDARVQSATSDASYSQTQAQQLTPINQVFDITGSTGILAALEQFGTAFSNLSVTPNDPTLGAAALNAAGNAATAFRSAASTLDSLQSQNGLQIQTTVAQINGLAAQIQQLNAQVATSAQPNPNLDASLRNALDRLSSLVDITVSRSADGAVSVLAGGQLPVVVGDQVFTLSADPTAAPGSQVSSSAGGASPSKFTGQLGALLDTQNGVLTQILGSSIVAGSLNTLAAGFASRVNTLLQSGVTGTGAAGVPIFVYDKTLASNSARTLTLDASVTASQLAVGSTGASPQANGIANALALLPGSTAVADQISGLSSQSLFGSIAASVGQQLSNARDAGTSDQANLTAAREARQQQSGVSLDQAAVDITTLERAYQAAAKVVSVIDQLTSDTMGLIK